MHSCASYNSCRLCGWSTVLAGLWPAALCQWPDTMHRPSCNEPDVDWLIHQLHPSEAGQVGGRQHSQGTASSRSQMAERQRSVASPGSCALSSAPAESPRLPPAAALAEQRAVATAPAILPCGMQSALVPESPHQTLLPPDHWILLQWIMTQSVVSLCYTFNGQRNVCTSQLSCNTKYVGCTVLQ